MSTAEQVKEEEREARRRHREGQALARKAQRARAEKARLARTQERARARAELRELKPQLTSARRRYFAALSDAVRDRRRDTAADVAARFDIADREMGRLLALTTRERKLRAVAR